MSWRVTLMSYCSWSTHWASDSKEILSLNLLVSMQLSRCCLEWEMDSSVHIHRAHRGWKPLGQVLRPMLLTLTGDWFCCELSTGGLASLQWDSYILKLLLKYSENVNNLWHFYLLKIIITLESKKVKKWLDFSKKRELSKLIVILCMLYQLWIQWDVFHYFMCLWTHSNVPTAYTILQLFMTLQTHLCQNKMKVSHLIKMKG